MAPCRNGPCYVVLRMAGRNGNSFDTALRDVDDALRDLEQALDANALRMAQLKRRIAEIRRQRSAGRSYREIVEATEGDLSVQLITEATQALAEFGARVRRAEALALYGEGMTMEEIAKKFGVTRQRVSALLRDADGRIPSIEHRGRRAGTSATRS